MEELRRENQKLRTALIGTRIVLIELKKVSPEGLHKGFDQWLAKIDEALK